MLSRKIIETQIDRAARDNYSNSNKDSSSFLDDLYSQDSLYR